MEKEIRESTLARVMPELTKGKITKANKKHGIKFAPKYRAFNILQNNIEDVVKKSTLMWKFIYGLQIVKEGQENPFEGRNENDEDEDDNKKEGEKEKDKEEVAVEKDIQKDNMATTDQKQQEQSVQDTQMPPPSPPHVTTTPVDLVTVQDVPDTSGQNINPLTIEGS